MNFLHRLTRPVARFAQRWRAHAGLIQAFFATLAFALGCVDSRDSPIF
jgi:hypothetical protein